MSEDSPNAENQVVYVLRCPCGLELTGDSEDDLVTSARAHLAEQHPRLVGTYDRDDILVMSYRRRPHSVEVADK